MFYESRRLEEIAWKYAGSVEGNIRYIGKSIEIDHVKFNFFHAVTQKEFSVGVGKVHLENLAENSFVMWIANTAAKTFNPDLATTTSEITLLKWAAEVSPGVTLEVTDDVPGRYRFTMKNGGVFSYSSDELRKGIPRHMLDQVIEFVTKLKNENDEETPNPINVPKSNSFDDVNEFIHSGAGYEELQNVCLGLATELEYATNGQVDRIAELEMELAEAQRVISEVSKLVKAS